MASGPDGEYGVGEDNGVVENPAKDDAAKDRLGPLALVAGASKRFVRVEKGARAEEDLDRLQCEARGKTPSASHGPDSLYSLLQSRFLRWRLDKRQPAKQTARGQCTRSYARPVILIPPFFPLSLIPPSSTSDQALSPGQTLCDTRTPAQGLRLVFM
jgi:hypothetical protein